MGLQRDRFTVYVETDHMAEFEATITHQDMLRGEQMMLQTPGTVPDQYLMQVTSWCWASLMRQGDYAGAFQQFRDADCQGIEKGEPVDVDPTPQATAAGTP